MDWKAKMPRATPAKDKTSVVFAIKTCRGARLEIVGDMDEQQVLAAWNIAQSSRDEFKRLAPKLIEIGLLKTAPEKDAAPVPAQAEKVEPAASSACPICWKDTPHGHSSQEVVEWAKAQASRFLPDIDRVVVIKLRDEWTPNHRYIDLSEKEIEDLCRQCDFVGGTLTGGMHLIRYALNMANEKAGRDARTSHPPTAPQSLLDALKFYADGGHFIRHDADAWDTVSGEPPNFYEDDANTATVEDGSIARAAMNSCAPKAADPTASTSNENKSLDTSEREARDP